MLPKSIKELAALLSNWPGIGPRQAIRLAIHLSQSSGKSEELERVLLDLKSIKKCSLCFLLHTNQSKLCDICSDKNRDQDMVAIVEKVTDLLSLEQGKTFNGRYLIIGELSKDGILKPENIKRLEVLKKNLKTKKAKEIILAFSPTKYGDLNASMLEAELKDLTKKISRLGRGIPTGGEIEFADEQTLGEAFRHRD